MYSVELDTGDVHSTFIYAVHHLKLAAAMFEQLSPHEFDAAKAIVRPGDLTDTVASLLAVISTEMETSAWLQSWKKKGAIEMASFADDDPDLDRIWDRYEVEIRKRLSAVGESEEGIDMELGDMGSMLREYREARLGH